MLMLSSIDKIIHDREHIILKTVSKPTGHRSLDHILKRALSIENGNRKPKPSAASRLAERSDFMLRLVLVYE